MPLPRKISQDETQTGRSGLGLATLGAAGTARSGASYYGSRRLDQSLAAAGFEQGGHHGVARRALLGFLRSARRGDMESLARYADASSLAMTQDVAKGVTGLESMGILGPWLKRQALSARKLPVFGFKLYRALNTAGAHLTQSAPHPHFSGFPTAGQGIRTLVGEKANWGGLSLENMGHIIHKALASNGWQANDAAARSLDEAFMQLIREGYGGPGGRHVKLIKTDPKNIKPILAAVLDRVGTGASPEAIARGIGPKGADITKSLYDAVRGTFTNSASARHEIANLAKTPAGMLALQAASHTARVGAAAHAKEILALGLLRAFRSRGFRHAAGVTGLLGAALMGYGIHKRTKK